MAILVARDPAGIELRRGLRGGRIRTRRRPADAYGLLINLQGSNIMGYATAQDGTSLFAGDDDQIVPIDAPARLAAPLVPEAELKVYRGASHGLFATRVEQFNRDLLEFIKG
jgi:pimeloyl-ACP methyl ester carboxylesterase